MAVQARLVRAVLVFLGRTNSILSPGGDLRWTQPQDSSGLSQVHAYKRLTVDWLLAWSGYVCVFIGGRGGKEAVIGSCASPPPMGYPGDVLQSQPSKPLRASV